MKQPVVCIQAGAILLAAVEGCVATIYFAQQEFDRMRDARRWWMVTGVAFFALVSYLERSNISVTAEMMMPALGITRIQMGEIFTSFLVGYAIFQIPGGWAGDRYGPRITLAVSALVWGAMSLLTGLIPQLLHGKQGKSFWALASVRFLLGMAEATTFPVANRVVRNWMPPEQRAFGNSIVFLGTSLASAIAGPSIAWMMMKVGWQQTFYYCSLPAWLLAVLWYVLARDRAPANDLSAQAQGIAKCARTTAGTHPASLVHLLRQRNVLLLICSYVSEGYVLFIFVFWLYIYLVEQRGFTTMRGGGMVALPWIAAFCISPLGGIACDRISRRYGRLTGTKAVVMTAYALSGLMLFLAAYARAPWLSVAALTLSVTFLMSAESPFWASAAYLSGEHVGPLSGVMNTAGIIGGIASTMLVPVLAQRFGWLTALGSGTAMALLCVLLISTLKEQPITPQALAD